MRRNFEAHRAYYAERQRCWEQHVEQLRARATQLIRQRLAGSLAEEHEAIVAYKVHVYEGMAGDHDADVPWVRPAASLGWTAAVAPGDGQGARRLRRWHGLEANRTVLETFSRYHHEQGPQFAAAPGRGDRPRPGR